MLKPYTVVNKEQLYSTCDKNIKVIIDFATMQVEVVEFGIVPRIIDKGFYIDPRNAACAAARILYKMGMHKEAVAC
jgi:hypothetical protein